MIRSDRTANLDFATTSDTLSARPIDVPTNDASKNHVVKRSWILHPWLFSIYPMIALYARNVHQAAAQDLVEPIELAAAITSLAWLAASFAFRDRVRGGFAATLAVIAYYRIETWEIDINQSLYWVSGVVWVGRSYQVGPWIALGSGALILTALGFFSIRRARNAAALNRFLNLFSLILLGFPLVTIAETKASKPVSQVKTAPPILLPTLAEGSRRKTLPDIYYIVLDGLARSDVLLDRFALDVEPFIQRLESKGFYVARRSTSNYAQTPLSLSSSLNGVYLDELVDPTAVDLGFLGSLIRESAVMSALRKLGYESISYSSGFDQTENPRADEYRSPYPYVSGFHLLLMSNTPAARFFLNPIRDDSYTMTRERTFHVFKTLPEIPRHSAPTFTFAHILAPHPPFVFGRHGEDVSPHQVRYYLSDGNIYKDYYGSKEHPQADYVPLYRNEATYVLEELERTIDQILSQSKSPPVIVIQGDHGSGSHLDVHRMDATDLPERMSIFNAYYLPPDADHGALYPTITPVNSFRAIFNACFDANLPILPDRNYFSTWNTPCEFVEVTEQVAPPNSGGLTPSQPNQEQD